MPGCRYRAWFAASAVVVPPAWVEPVLHRGQVAAPDGSQREADVLAVALVVGETVAFVFRRRAPLGSLVTVMALVVVFWVRDYPTNFDAFSLLAAYAPGANPEIIGPFRPAASQSV